MRVVVTGAAGFIGSRLSGALLRSHHEVVCLDAVGRDTHGVAGAARLQLLGAHPRATVTRVNLATDDIAASVENADCVFHLAALPGVRESWSGRFSDYVDSNVVGSQRLLEAVAAAHHRPRLVFASSSSIYGDQETMPVNEDAQPSPRSPYGVTKLAMEHLAAAYRADAELDVVCARLFTVCGPGQRPDMAISRLFAAATGGSPFVVNELSSTRDYTHVDDVVGALIALSSAPRLSRTAYNVSGGNRSSLGDVIALVTATVGQPPVLVEGGVGRGDPRHTWADSTAIRADVDWVPRRSLEDAVRDQWHDADGRGGLRSLGDDDGDSARGAAPM